MTIRPIGRLTERPVAFDEKRWSGHEIAAHESPRPPGTGPTPRSPSWHRLLRRRRGRSHGVVDLADHLPGLALHARNDCSPVPTGAPGSARLSLDSEERGSSRDQAANRPAWTPSETPRGRLAEAPRPRTGLLRRCPGGDHAPEIDELRYAEEHAVRYEAVRLSPERETRDRDRRGARRRCRWTELDTYPMAEPETTPLPTFDVIPLRAKSARPSTISATSTPHRFKGRSTSPPYAARISSSRHARAPARPPRSRCLWSIAW